MYNNNIVWVPGNEKTGQGGYKSNEETFAGDDIFMI